MSDGQATQLAGLDARRVRLTCGNLVFQRAEGHVRRGSVLNPRLEGDVLRAEVNTSGHTQHKVAVAMVDGHLSYQCGCALPRGYCEHAGALLLAWVRDRRSFRVQASSAATAARQSSALLRSSQEPPCQGDSIGAYQESPLGQLIRLLEMRNVQDLREIARRRDLALRGAAKADLVRQVAAGLLDPAGLDAAVAKLSAVERVVVDVVRLLGRDRFVGPGQVEVALAGLQVTAAEPTAFMLYDLANRGLVVSDVFSGYGGNAFCVPDGVAAHLPAPEYLVNRVATEVLVEAAVARRARPDELLYVLCRRLQGRPVRRRYQTDQQPVDKGHRARLRGWLAAQDEVAVIEAADDVRWRQGVVVTVLPPPADISDEDIDGLAPVFAGSREGVELGCQLLRELRLVEIASEWSANEDRLRQFLRQPAALRQQELAQGWLELATWTELALVLRGEDRLRLRVRIGGYHETKPEELLGHLATSRRMIVWLLARLDEGVWYSLAALSEAMRRLAGDELAGLTFGRNDPNWWLEWQGRRLDPKEPNDWSLGYGRFVEAVVCGPLRWLGVAEVAGRTAFQLRGLRGMLGLAAPDAEDVDPLVVGADLCITAPFGAGGFEVHDFLQEISEPAEVSAEGLVYRVTPRSACRAFAAGHDAGAIVSFLERASTGVPDVAGNRLADWWRCYGRLRLYRDLSLIELADDYVLPELLNTTRMAEHLVFEFSPRLIAVDPAGVDDLVAEMVRKGHTPKVVEGKQ